MSTDNEISDRLVQLQTKRDRQSKVVDREQSKLRELDAQVAAFELVIKELSGDPIAASSSSGRITAASRVAAFVESRDGEFDVDDVVKALKRDEHGKCTRNSIQTALSRLVKKEEIVIVRHANGSEKALYSSSAHQSQAANTDSENTTNLSQLLKRLKQQQLETRELKIPDISGLRRNLEVNIHQPNRKYTAGEVTPAVRLPSSKEGSSSVG